MASLITLEEAQAWGEKTKLAPAWANGLDTALLEQVQAEVLGNMAQVADTSLWTDSVTTPSIVKTVIAKFYVAWLIDRTYSSDGDLSDYATLLRSSAMALQAAIVGSEIDIPGNTITDTGLPSSWPDDTTEGPYFTMSAVD